MKTKKTWILTAAGVVLLAIICVVTALLLSDAEPEPEESAVSVIKLSDASVTSMKITSGGNVVDLVKKDGVWVYRDNPAESPDQGSMESALTMVCYLYAREKLFDSVENLSVYGLNPPEMLIEITADEKDSYSFSFGAYTSARDAVFMKYSGSDAVYLYDLDSFSILQKAAGDMRDLTIDIDAAEIAKIEIMRTSGERVPVIMEKTPENRRVALETWRLTSPFNAIANTDAATLVRSFFASPRFASFAGEEVLEEYGFESSSAYIYLEEEGGKSVKLLVGARTSGGRYYCIQEGRSGVYELPGGFESVLEMKDENLFPGTVLPVSSEKYADVNLYVTNEIYTLVKRSENNYTLNDRLISDEALEKLFERMAALPFAGVSEDAAVSELPYAEITLNNGGNTMVFSFHKYRNEFYAVCLDGCERPSGYVKAETLNELISAFEEAERG